MKLKYTILGLLLGTVLILETGFADTVNVNLKHTPFYVQYPLNNSADRPLILQITVPPLYRSLEDENQILNSSSYLAEFVPHLDDAYQWTQIITGNAYIPAIRTPKEIIQYMQTRFQHQAEGVKIINEEEKLYSGYQKACTTMDYNINNRHEMVYICFYCGPQNCIGVQNAKLWPLSSTLNPNQLAQELKTELNAFTQIKAP